MRYIAILWVFLFPSFVEAATYWVSPSGGETVCANVSGTDDPGAYMTLAAMDSNNCASAGDTVIWKPGTYTGPRVQFTSVLPAGTSASVVSTHLCETDQGCIIAFSSVPNGTGVINTTNATHYRIGQRGNGFIADCVNGGAGCGGFYLQLSGSIIATNVVIEGNHVTNQHAGAFNMAESQPTNYYDGAKFLYNSSDSPVSPNYTGDGSVHGIYIKGFNVEVAYNWINGYPFEGQYASWAIQGWHNAQRARVHHNMFIVPSTGRGQTIGDDEIRPANADNWSYNNVFTCPTLDCTIGLSFSGNNRANGSRAYNNTLYGFSTFLNNQSGNLDSHFVNNVCSGGSCTIINAGTNLNCGGTCTTTNPTVTAASHFTDAANGDFSLKSGSTLIDAGVNVGLPFNGSAPDRGAYESISAPTASITTNVLTLTFAMTHVPIQNLSTTGVSVACTPNPTACPSTPVVALVTKRAGTDSIVDVTISGIASNACLSGQTWTVTYAPGTWSNSIDVGGAGTRNQKVFAFTNLAVSNACTGSGPSGYPGTPYIRYDFSEGSGTTLTNLGSLGASGNGTLNGGSWASGGGVTLAQQSSTDYVAIPYGSGVNPTTQSLTIAFTVDVLAGNESAVRSYFGSQLGTDQRFHVLTSGGTWREAVRAFSGNSASEFSVAASPTNVCITANAATDVVTLHINGVASTTTGGLQSGVTSYTLASNFELGRIATLTTGGGGTYRNFVLYQSVEDCAAIYTASLGAGSSPSGTFTQVAVRAQDVFTDSGGSPVNQRALNTATKVSVGGASTWLFQINCDNCNSTAFRVSYQKNGVGAWLQVPATETSDGIYMWGTSAPAFFNNGAPGAEISGTCTEQTGAMITTTSQTPTIPFPSSGCVVLGYVVRIGTNAAPGDFFNLRLETQAGGPLDTYDNLARIDVIGRQMTH